MDNSYVAGFCVGFLIVLFVFLIFKVINKNKKQCEYDERQILARNSAYKTSFFTSISYMALISVLDSFDIKWAEFGTQMILGIILSVCVFCSICIFKDAYRSYTENSIKRNIFLFVIVIISNITAFVINVAIDGETMFTNGLLTYHSVNLFVGIMFTILLIMVIIKHMINKRTVEDEEWRIYD